MPKSYFTVKMQSIQAAVLDKIKKGDFFEFETQNHTVRLIVNIAKTIGKAYNSMKEMMEDTDCVSVDYSSSDGYHIYPRNRNNWG